MCAGCGSQKAPVEADTPAVTEAAQAVSQTDATAQTGAVAQADAGENETAVNNETMAETAAETEFDPDAVTVISVPAFEMPEITVTKFTLSNDLFAEAPSGFTADDVLSGEFTAPETAAEAALVTTTSAAAGSTTITDDSGAFSYTGELKQAGDDTHGYIMIPADFVKFNDIDSNNAIQYSDTSGQNVITLNKNPCIDSYSAVQSVLAYMDEDESISGGTGATLKVAGYDSYQAYGRYSDGFYIVVWLIKDPANPDDSYYLSMEFDDDHQYMMACSSTFKTAEDYKN